MEHLIRLLRTRGITSAAYEPVWPLVYAGLAGIVAALGTVALVESLSYVHELVFVDLSDALPFGRWSIVPVVALGGLVAALVTRWVGRESRGHGVPDVMYAFEHGDGRIPWRVSLSGAMATVATIGAGGSAGQEGPSVHIGAGAASLLGRGLRVQPEYLRLMLAAGAAGGISAVFNAPLAGSFFALEVVLRRFTVRNFSGVVLAAVLANVVFRELAGSEDALTSPAYHLQSGWEILPYFILGVGTAVLGILLVHTLAFVRDTRRALRLGIFGPALGGALVGLIGVWRPEILGTGVHEMGEFLRGEGGGELLLALAFLKVLSSSLTIGSGGTGGVFMPSLFIGAALGGAYGQALDQSTIFAAAPPGAYAVAGMAGVFAGAARAPITSLFLGFEVTQDYGLVAPLMTVVVVSTLISQLMMKETIYSEELRRIGIDIEGEKGRDPLETIPVAQAMSQAPTIFTRQTTLGEAEAQFQRTGADAIPVLEGARVIGMVTPFDLIRRLEDGLQPTLSVDEVMSHPAVTVGQEETLQQAALRMDTGGVRTLAVLDGERYVGLLGRSDILTAYAEARTAEQDIDAEQALLAATAEPEARFHRVRVDELSPLNGRTLEEIRFPEGSLVVSVRRHGRTVIPRGSVRLLSGDAIVILAEEAATTALREADILRPAPRSGAPRIPIRWARRG